MSSDPIELYDLGIIGGGIAGAAIARDAALRDMTVVLFEKNTFGSGTSGKSSKLIHGGVRYLELAWNALRRTDWREAWKNFCFVFVSLKESRLLRRIAPSLVEPLPLIVPIYRSDRRQPWMIHAGAILYFILAVLSGGGRFPTIYTSRQAVLKTLPDLDPEGLLGAVKIWDHWVDDQSLVLATMESARKSGAKCFEHSPVNRYEHDEASNTYLIFSTGTNGESVTRVRKLVNASGPWIDKTRELGHERDRSYLLPVAGSHITLASFLPCSVLLQAQDGRFFFVIDHAGTARVGTTERPEADPDHAEPSSEEIDYLLGSLKRYFPGKEFSRKDILSQDSGVRPLSAPATERDPNEIPREHEIRISPSGCIHMVGVKLTDHRRAAEEVVDRLVPLLLPVKPALRRRTRTHQLSLTES